jgi:hypothetical protein
MPGKRIRQAQEFYEYLSKRGIERFTYTLNPSVLHNDRIYAFPQSASKGNYGCHQLRSISSFVRAIKHIKLVRLWTGTTDKDKWGYHLTHPRNIYQDFDSFDAFREYCLIVKLSGL